MADLIGPDVSGLDLPRAPLHGGGARAEGEESDHREVEFPENLLGPCHLEVDYGTERSGHIGSSGAGGEVVLEFLGCLLAERVGSGSGRAGRGSELDDLGKWVLCKRGRNGGGESGGDDDGGVVIAGEEVVAEFHARLEVALPGC